MDLKTERQLRQELADAWPLIDQYKAALPMLQRYVERYRYLRDRVPAEVLGQVKSAAGCWIDGEDDDGVLMLLTGDDADAAIDAAMAAAVSKRHSAEVTGLRRPKAVASPVDPPVRPAVAGDYKC